MFFNVLDHESQRVQEEIVFLRQLSYGHNYGECDHMISRLKWNETDKQSLHLGMRCSNSSALIASLRMTIFQSKEKLEASTLISTPSFLSPPFALLARASCAPPWQKKGYHSLLRCRALEICKIINIYCVLGSIESSSTRANSLKNLGYVDLAIQSSWGNDGLIKNSKEVKLIGLICPESLQTAIEILRTKHQLTLYEPEVMTGARAALHLREIGNS